MVSSPEYNTFVVYFAIKNGQWGIYNTVIKTWVPATELTANDIFRGIRSKIVEEAQTEQVAILNLISIYSN